MIECRQALHALGRQGIVCYIKHFTLVDVAVRIYTYR